MALSHSKAAAVAHSMNELSRLNLSSVTERKAWEEVVCEYLWDDSDSDLSEFESEYEEDEHRSGEVPVDSPEVSSFVRNRLSENNSKENELVNFQCSCKAVDGRTPCSDVIPPRHLEDLRLQYQELTHDELDLVLLAKFSCGFHGSPMTQSTNRKAQSEPQRNRTDFFFEGQRICRSMFVYMHGISKVISVAKDDAEAASLGSLHDGSEMVKPCSVDITGHYSFDFAQQIHYPYTPQQPGAIFFKTPRKCGIFGIMSEAVQQQINYLIDEAVNTGKGANTVISMVHHFFYFFSLGETKLFLHADNCCGQNKNNMMLWYLMWRLLTGRHRYIKISFMIAGHTKFGPDWAFGLAKKKLRHSALHCLDDIFTAIKSSSKVNRVQLCGREDGEVLVKTYDWASYLSQFFRRVNQIRKYHHFWMESESPGSIFLQGSTGAEPVKESILKTEGQVIIPSQLPPVIAPVGLSRDRQMYLFKEIRKFVSDDQKDIVAPEPRVV